MDARGRLCNAILTYRRRRWRDDAHVSGCSDVCVVSGVIDSEKPEDITASRPCVSHAHWVGRDGIEEHVVSDDKIICSNEVRFRGAVDLI